jgi:hypothetical protein
MLLNYHTQRRCEACGYPATHICSGLDTPVVYFCDKHGRQHEADQVCNGQLTRMGAQPTSWWPTPAELLRHMELFRDLKAAVEGLDPAAADTAPYAEWDAAKWRVFNAAVRLVKETVQPDSDAAVPARQTGA